MHKERNPLPRIDTDISELFQAISGWNYEELKNDIAKNGVRIPIELADDGTVIDGHQRLKAWLELGKEISEIPVRIRTYESRLEKTNTAIKLNLIRRHLNNAQRAWMAYKHYLEEERKRARERQTTKSGRSEKLHPDICQEGDGEAFDLAAKKVGLSGRTLRRAASVFDHAPFELVELVLKGKVSINRAYKNVQAKEELLEQASNSLLECFEEGKVNLSKALKISELLKEDQPVVVQKVIEEKPSEEQTEWLVTTILEKPEKKDEILTKSIIELTPPPREIQEFEKKYGPNRPKFSNEVCPHCGQSLIVNWPLQMITKAVKKNEK